MIRGFSHPPPRHHPPQQLPHATFEPHHRTVVVRGVKERSTLAQRMSSRSRQVSLRVKLVFEQKDPANVTTWIPNQRKAILFGHRHRSRSSRRPRNRNN